MNIDFSLKNWNWTEFCGSEFRIWTDDQKNLSLCFQITCLQIPILCLISIVSSYYSTSQFPYILRSYREKCIINCRLWLTSFLVILPVIKIVVLMNLFQEPLWTCNYMLSALEPFTWILHFCYLLSLKHRLGPTLRGPVVLGSLWTMYFAIYVVTVRTYYIFYMNVRTKFVMTQLIFCSIEMVLLTVYAFSLIPSENSNFRRILDETQPSHEDDMREQLLNEYQSFWGHVEPCYLGVASEGTTWWSKLLFLWANPLMKKGMFHDLKVPDDLFDLPLDLTSCALYEKLHIAMIEQRERTGNVGKVSLFKALHRSFAKEFYGVGILKFANDIMTFVSPLLLNRLIVFIEDKHQPIINGYFYAGGIFLTSLLGAVFISQFTYRINKVGIKLRGCLVGKVYQRLFLMPSVDLSSERVGEVINYISTDIDRIVNSCNSFHAFWSIPFQMVVTLYLLYTQVGVACIAGVLFSLVLIPINKIIANKIGILSADLMREKDGRIKVMTEIISGIRVIKLNVWEEYFKKKVFGYRDNELKYLKKRKYLDAICVYFWATTPVIISILTFVMYVLLGGKLNAAIVFTSIALLNMLINPLNAFPFVLNGLYEAWVSLKRVQKFFHMDEIDIKQYYITIRQKEEEEEAEGGFDNSEFGSSEMSNSTSKTSIYIKNGFFDWGNRNFRLQNINLDISDGDFFGVYGPTGSGKSSLLATILAEMNKTKGMVYVKNIEAGVGYVSQTPWIQQCSVKDNILFGKPFDSIKYRKVIEACALAEDFQSWPNGDAEVVGEGGATLSGGQKARISLARAVYQEKSIYLLDDVLSAVDTRSASHIFHECINGLLKNTTRIFVTHNRKFLMSADCVAILKDGMISNQGPPKIIFSNYRSDLKTNIDHKVETERLTSFQDTSLSADKLHLAINENEEQSAVGTVSLAVYFSYCKAVGYVLTTFILLFVCLMQFSRNSTDLWLSMWLSSDSKYSNIIIDIVDRLFQMNLAYVVGLSGSTNSLIFIWERKKLRTFSAEDLKVYPTTYFYLSVYGFIGLVNSFVTIWRSFLFAFGSVRAAKHVHVSLLSVIIKAEIAFFDITPLGRIINRFSSDMFTVDDSLPFMLNIFLAQVFSLIGTLSMSIYGMPWLCLFIAPLLPFYHWLQNYYRLTSRELKRLSSITLSPLYSHFSETISGLTTIRAFKDVTRFRRENEDKLEDSQKCIFSNSVASLWLSVRLYFIGVTIIGAICLISILQHQFSTAQPVYIGLAFSYALSLINVLGSVINAFVETEQEMIAMERICEYIQISELEESTFSDEQMLIDQSIPFFWPSQGIVAFSNVSFKYRPNVQESLKNVSFEIPAGEKVGIVGRTGAGKSSLFTCLFRVREICSGSIKIDNVDIRKLSLKRLRSKMVIIPQDPFLFSGSIRENIDPFNTSDDQKLRDVISQCYLQDLVENLGGIYGSLNCGGNNLSVGEKQLFCLARAIIRKAKVVCIDEATSNIDEDTDRKVQETIRRSFKNSTVFIIAHRTETVTDCDRILVMDNGEVVENDSPAILLQNPSSHFYRLVNNIQDGS